MSPEVLFVWFMLALLVVIFLTAIRPILKISILIVALGVIVLIGAQVYNAIGLP